MSLRNGRSEGISESGNKPFISRRKKRNLPFSKGFQDFLGTVWRSEKTEKIWFPLSSLNSHFLTLESNFGCVYAWLGNFFYAVHCSSYLCAEGKEIIALLPSYEMKWVDSIGCMPTVDFKHAISIHASHVCMPAQDSILEIGISEMNTIQITSIHESSCFRTWKETGCTLSLWMRWTKR